MVHAALGGRLDSIKTETDPIFGLAVPTEVSDVPKEVLRPRDTWPDPAAYDVQAKKLADMFRKNFEKFGGLVSEAVKNAGPRG
jgi:phosphoenolpyruvate carboxykinase (ATP)